MTHDGIIKTLRTAISQALTYLGDEAPLCSGCAYEWDHAIKLLRAALEQPQGEQELVAYRHMHEDGWEYYDAPTGSDCDECQPLYTHPQPKREPLTDEQIRRLWDEIDGWLNFARAIERTHGIGVAVPSAEAVVIDRHQSSVEGIQSESAGY